jgi:hypothetical protein
MAFRSLASRGILAEERHAQCYRDNDDEWDNVCDTPSLVGWQPLGNDPGVEDGGHDETKARILLVNVSN